MKRCAAFVALAILLGLAVTSCSRPARSGFPIVPDEELVAQGEAIYEARCIFCHGNQQGEGRSRGAPPHNQAGHTWHHPDRLLFQWVLDGPPLRTAMPTFRGTLSEEEVRAVIAYIKTMWPEDVRRNQIEFSRVYEEQLGREQR